MGPAVQLPTDNSASELRRLARASKDARQSSRLLSLAAGLDGMSRADAAGSAGWTARPCGTGHTGSTKPGRMGFWIRGRMAHITAFAQATGRAGRDCRNGPDPAVDGVVRWRRVDLQRVIKERFGVEC